MTSRQGGRGHDHQAAPQSAKDRRDTLRLRYDIQVGVTSSHRLFVGLSSNISAGGLFIATEEDLHKGDMIDVRFSVPGSPHVFEKKATVQWTRPMDADAEHRTHVGAGVKLMDLSEEEQRILNAFLKVHDPIFFDV